MEEYFLSQIAESVSSNLENMFVGALRYLRILMSERVANLLLLEENAGTLDREMKVLKEMRDDLENEARNQELRPRMRRTRFVSEWLANVDALGETVSDLQASLAERPTFPERCSCDSLLSGCVLGGKVVDLLNRLREVRGRREDLGSQLVDEGDPDAVVPVPSKSSWIVGGEKTLSAVRDYIRDPTVGVIGIHGMGGIGKTTFLVEINNQFRLEGSAGDFDVVIFVTVSRDVSIFKVQEDIGCRLGFSRRGELGAGCPLPEKEGERRSTLYRALEEKRFLLLLDDLWERLELETVGIPRPDGRGRKVVFTTRREEVCEDMDAPSSIVRVSLLDEQESWKLFCSTLDGRVDLGTDTEIYPLAKAVAARCGGLPLALITVGRAMSSATAAGAWRHAVLTLGDFPNEIRGMQAHVLSILKFSLDKLDDEIAKECLLYCALFPESYNIEIERLVDYWIGEGFLEGVGDGNSSKPSTLSGARKRGDRVVRKLKYACLLEIGEEEETQVKMHDVVREMALWLTGGRTCSSTTAKRFIVCSRQTRLMELLEDAKMWEGAWRISVTQSGTLLLPTAEFECPDLSTILISTHFGRKGGLWVKLQLNIDHSFCRSIPSLRVLDLSGTDIEELPGAVGLLQELRHLNLLRTKIRELPKELGRLVNLRQLNLRETEELFEISREALTLPGLQALDLYASGYFWDSGGIGLTDLARGSGRLEELSVNLRTWPCLETLSSTAELQRCASRLGLIYMDDLTAARLSAALQNLERLRLLEIMFCYKLEEWRVDGSGNRFTSLGELTLDGLGELRELAVATGCFPSLRALNIGRCDRLEDLRWVGRLPCLEVLFLYNSGGLRELLVGGEQGDDDGPGSSSFRRLKSINLFELQALRSISGMPLLFPSLEKMFVSGCPQLKRLPIGQGGFKKIEEVLGDQEWWDAVECGDDGVKAALAPFFKPRPGTNRRRSPALDEKRC